MMYKLIVLLSGLFWMSCTRTSESIKTALSNDDFVRWSKDQQITPDMFEGKGSRGTYVMYIGIYFIYDLTEPSNIKFDVTMFMDKKKSTAALTIDRTDTDKLALLPVTCKLKFDHYEVYARKFRKCLLENRDVLNSDSEEQLKILAREYYDNAEKSWNRIMSEVESENAYNVNRFSELRGIIDADLEEYRDYDSSVNNYDENSSR